jgi:GGDEF domain-containing protein
VLLLIARLMRGELPFPATSSTASGARSSSCWSAAARAEQAAIRLRAAARQRRRPTSFRSVGHITVSIGFTELRTGDSPSGAFERADKAVYYAKQNGRNQRGVPPRADLIARGLLRRRDAHGDMELF